LAGWFNTASFGCWLYYYLSDQFATWLVDLYGWLIYHQAALLVGMHHHFKTAFKGGGATSMMQCC